MSELTRAEVRELERLLGERVRSDRPPAESPSPNTRVGALGRQSSFVGGGQNNTAGAQGAFVGGGLDNTASGQSSFVGGGATNTASGPSSFVGGGGNNTAGPGTCGFVIAQVFGTC